MAMRVLVTGIGGFVGPVLAGELLAHGHDVHGLVRRSVSPRLADLAVRIHHGDLLEPGQVDDVVGGVAPDAIVHLAGLSFMPAAEADPPAAYRANVDATLALLGAARARAPKARLLVVSSSTVYGAPAPAELPVTEDAPLRPENVYGASKAAAELAALQWGRGYGLDVVVARPFNHIGPGQDPSFVCAALARQIARMEAGRQEPVLRVGNVDPVRDFADVRDIAAGHVAVLERGRTGGVYNLCAGEGASIAEVIALLRTHARIPLSVRSDPALRRKTEAPRIVGSAARATRDTGWTPRIALTDALAAVLDDWRVRTARDTS
jgi:GDP-4-dehydro-6-deoxy-D-mannose reductase